MTTFNAATNGHALQLGSPFLPATTTVAIGTAHIDTTASPSWAIALSSNTQLTIGAGNIATGGFGINADTSYTGATVIGADLSASPAVNNAGTGTVVVTGTITP